MGCSLDCIYVLVDSEAIRYGYSYMGKANAMHVSFVLIVLGFKLDNAARVSTGISALYNTSHQNSTFIRTLLVSQVTTIYSSGSQAAMPCMEKLKFFPMEPSSLGPL